MKLLIAIPALNEEKSIGRIIERCLAARGRILSDSLITEVLITVVSDGSTDRTVELARAYVPEIQLVAFKKNRGYGAAIKEAWRQSDAEVLGFLDADGTCDPLFFTDLLKKMKDEEADIVLGCRMNSKSKMPLVRRIGNFVYAVLLSLFSSSRIRDTASGMRIVKRSCLPRLMPLPDGLHFTPAMSARALLCRDIKMVEINMPYQEREGRSKLSVIKDGLRFLRVILQTALLYQPGRMLGLAGLLSLAAGMAVMIRPALYYLGNSSLLDWMIYRFSIGALFGIASSLLVCSGYICSKIVAILLTKRAWTERDRGAFSKFFTHRYFWLVPAGLFLAGSLLIVPGLIQYFQTGHVYKHWSRFITMLFLNSLAVILAVTKVIDYSLDLMIARLSYLNSSKAESEWRV